jgi:shikimate 5-dehydrogenase
MALRLAPDAIACSINHSASAIQTLNNTKGHTQSIATYHQAIPLGWRNELPEVHTLPKRAQRLGFECIRITGESALSADNLACVALRQAVLQSSSISVIMYNTGTLGRTSVCLNPILSPVILPGRGGLGVTLSEAQKALTACFLNPKKHFTIVGQAVQHSLSPAMHNAAYSFCGLPHVYDALQANTLSDIRPILDDETYGGIAVSLPYKTAVLEYLDEINPDARDINAVNTVVLERQHKLDGSEKSIRKGYNTDYIGIRNCIYNHLSPANTIREGTTALIIGAGGMARAAIYACYQLGIRQICIDNRTINNAQKLAAYYHQWAKAKFGTEFQLEVIRSVDDPWPVYMRLPTIVISCLPAQKIGSESLIDIRVSEKWLQSTTGGVFLEVHTP